MFKACLKAALPVALFFQIPLDKRIFSISQLDKRIAALKLDLYTNKNNNPRLNIYPNKGNALKSPRISKYAIKQQTKFYKH